MNKTILRLGVVAFAATAILSGCGQNGGSPTGPGAPMSFRSVPACGDAGYLSQLSPVLPAWQDSIQAWLADPALLTDTPAWTDSTLVNDYLADLVPALQQWEGAINGRFASLLDTIADFDPAAGSTAYIGGLSATLASWEDSLETQRGAAFLADLPAFTPDTGAPVIACADTTVTCADSSGAVVAFDVTVTDDCDAAVTVVCEPASGSTFPLGETVVTCTATDAAGNTATCEFTVTVLPDLPPVIHSAVASPCEIWPPNHKWVDVAITVDAEDTCDSTLTCRIIEVWSNEAVNGKGDGNTEPDWMVTGDLSLKVRAERSGNGSSRIYSVRVRCEDSNGQGDERVVEIRVPHDQGKK